MGGGGTKTYDTGGACTVAGINHERKRARGVISLSVLGDQ